MNSKMVRAMDDKYVYIDIDGTLAEYRFDDHLSAKDGTDNGMTMQEIEDHIFLRSRPLKLVQNTIKRANIRGIWVCGDIISPIELEDKFVWLNKNCPGINFNGFFWFADDKYWSSFLSCFDFSDNDYDIVTPYGIIIKGNKKRMWDWIVKHNFHNLKDTVFVDDKLPYLKYAEEIGIASYHMSSFID